MSSVDNGSTASYVYNALGERVERNVGGTYTEYLYDKDGSEVGENNRTAWTETWAAFQGRHLFHFSGGSTYFTHMDSLGTTSIVTDYSTGAVVQDELHYPWGQQWAMLGTMQEERFARLHHRDNETSLDPTLYRMYSSNQGRWLGPDALGGNVFDPQSSNRYAYVLNDPRANIDPLGLQCVTTDDGFLADDGTPPPCDGVSGPGDSITVIGYPVGDPIPDPCIYSGYGCGYGYYGYGSYPYSGGGGGGTSSSTPPPPPPPPQTSKPSCASVWVQSFTGIPPSELLGALQAAANGGSFWAGARAAAYAATTVNTHGGIGLLCPFCSSSYRAWWTLSEGLGFASATLPLATATIWALKADYDTFVANHSGSCQAVF